MALAEAGFVDSGVKQRRFAELAYGARSWDRQRRVIARIEHGPKGANPRFVVTNLAGDGRDLYERLYCARGEMENRIKEQQLQLFADRTSCHRWWPNQFRLLLASLAYTLLDADPPPRSLAGTEMARAQCATIRLKLLKVGAVITRIYQAGALPPVLRLPRAGPFPPGRRPAENPDNAALPAQPVPCQQPNRQAARRAPENGENHPKPPDIPPRRRNPCQKIAHPSAGARKTRQCQNSRPFMKYPG